MERLLWFGLGRGLGVLYGGDVIWAFGCGVR